MSVSIGKKATIGDYVNYTAIGVFSVLCILPFVYIISVSLTDSEVYVPLRFSFIPEKFSLGAYTYILSTHFFRNAFVNTLKVTIAGTILNLIVTFTGAYALTKKEMPGRNILLSFIVLTFMFDPGIVPNYVLVRSLGLINTHWALILPLLTNAWSMIIVKSFMNSIPNELEQSAYMDGCNELQIFSKIIVPLSMPAIAAFTLFFAVMRWNDYFSALIYLNSTAKWTLQILVRSLLIDGDAGGFSVSVVDDVNMPQETIRMASVVLAMLPILLVYPFLQKYFVKGVMIGAIKG